MGEDDRTPNDAGDLAEWEYASPPTAYDLVRDNLLIRCARLAVHGLFRASMHCYHGIRSVGRENVLDNLPCIITPNHTSHIDNVAVFASLPWRCVNRVCSVAAKDYFFDNPILAMMARLVANGIPLDHKGENTRGLRLCARKLRDGGGIIIFPEGRRTHTGEVGHFKPGAVALCRGLKVPVIPTYLKGTFESLSPSHWFPRGKQITVTYGEPVRFWEGDLADLDHDAAAKVLEDRVREMQRAAEDGPPVDSVSGR